METGRRIHLLELEFRLIDLLFLCDWELRKHEIERERQRMASIKGFEFMVGLCTSISDSKADVSFYKHDDNILVASKFLSVFFLPSLTIL